MSIPNSLIIPSLPGNHKLILLVWVYKDISQQVEIQVLILIERSLLKFIIWISYKWNISEAAINADFFFNMEKVDKIKFASNSQINFPILCSSEELWGKMK